MKAGLEARRFHVKAEVTRPENQWGSALVRIFDGDTQIGEYSRNHPGWADTTFEPFELGGQWFALYSREYTATRVMSLPDCRDLGGEENDPGGFCPVEFYVPRYKEAWTANPRLGLERRLDWWFESWAESHSEEEKHANGFEHRIGPWRSLAVGFVAGCIWGDDSSWKLQAIDLEKAADGIIERTERFGYLPLASGVPLSDCVSLQRYDEELRLTIIRQEYRNLTTGAVIDPLDM